MLFDLKFIGVSGKKHAERLVYQEVYFLRQSDFRVSFHVSLGDSHIVSKLLKHQALTKGLFRLFWEQNAEIYLFGGICRNPQTVFSFCYLVVESLVMLTFFIITNELGKDGGSGQRGNRGIDR